MDECIFCKIIKKEIPAEIIFEDDDFLVFKDIKPKAKVHLLIVPKKHIESINHLENGDNDLISKMFFLVKKIASENGVSDGYKLLFNVGRKGGQLVDHLHLHLMGGGVEND